MSDASDRHASDAAQVKAKASPRQRRLFPRIEALAPRDRIVLTTVRAVTTAVLIALERRSRGWHVDVRWLARTTPADARLWRDVLRARVVSELSMFLERPVADLDEVLDDCCACEGGA